MIEDDDSTTRSKDDNMYRLPVQRIDATLYGRDDKKDVTRIS